MHYVRHPRDGFATDFTDREVWSLALRRRDAHSVAVGHAAEQDRQSQTVAVDFGSARETKMTISCDLWFSRTSGVPLKISSACRKGRPGRSGLGADGAGPRLGLDSALARLHARLTRGAALGEGQRPEPPEPDDRAAVAANSVLVPRQTLESGVDLRGLADLAVEHGDLEVFAERLDRVRGILRAPAGLARPALRHPRADVLLEPGAPLQEEGFELLHDPMIERACLLHSVLTLSRRYSLGRRAPTSDSSGWNSSVGAARSPPPSAAAIIAATAIHLSLLGSERGAKASMVSGWGRTSILS